MNDDFSASRTYSAKTTLMTVSVALIATAIWPYMVQLVNGQAAHDVLVNGPGFPIVALVTGGCVALGYWLSRPVPRESHLVGLALRLSGAVIGAAIFCAANVLLVRLMLGEVIPFTLETAYALGGPVFYAGWIGATLVQIAFLIRSMIFRPDR